MKFRAEIDIMPLEALLDPQGKAVNAGLRNLGLNNISSVRVGKHITLQLEAASEAEARAEVEEACKKLLANLIMESYRFELVAG
jgi:phosphoribosylformylglycinamidine synthase